MSTYELLTDIRDSIKVCLEATDCEYHTFVSLGEPPADCNSIGIYLDRKDRNPANGECSSSILDTTVKVMITRCCGEQEVFSSTQEEADALCFLTDLDLLVNCINCSLGEALSDALSCSAYISSIDTDLEKQGGCYSATLELELTEQDCCLEEEVDD